MTGRFLSMIAMILVIPACDQTGHNGDDGGIEDGWSPDGDSPADARGDRGDREPFDGCAFPFLVPQEHVFTDEIGFEYRVYDRGVVCTVKHDATDALVYLEAVPTGFEQYDIAYQATRAFVCQDEQLEQLPSGSFYYRAFHHGWNEMGVEFAEHSYVFGWSEICIGYRPCTASFDVFDVYEDGNLVAEKQSTTCILITQNGNPLPLVPQVRVPAAGDDLTFPMGSTQGDPDEQPVHDVFLKPVRMDMREATNADFALFLHDHGNDCDGHPCLNATGPGVHLSQQSGHWSPDTGFEDVPVVQVTWYGADAYCKWRNYMLLPTEAQREMATSAAGTRSYPWGNEAPDCERALHEGCGSTEPTAGCGHPQGDSLEGVCDLGGNLAEWVADWYDPDYYATCTTDCRDPKGPEQPTGRKGVRGGSFVDPATRLRAADRDDADPASSSAHIGVRCVRFTFPQNP